MTSRCDLRVLLVEDDEPKLDAVRRFLEENYLDVGLYVAQSLTSAVERLSENAIDLAIIDMSIPTYDFSRDRAGGGRPEGFGGEDIARFIESEAPDTRYVILTQYEEFSAESGTRSLAELREHLKETLGRNFLGVIHYSGQLGEWREVVQSVIGGMRKPVI
jgi:CheY-like chemotaxis protein